MRDFRRLQNDPPSGVTGAPMDNNIMAWQVCLPFARPLQLFASQLIYSGLCLSPSRMHHGVARCLSQAWFDA